MNGYNAARKHWMDGWGWDRAPDSPAAHSPALAPCGTLRQNIAPSCGASGSDGGWVSGGCIVRMNMRCDGE